MKTIVWFGFVLCAFTAAGKVIYTKIGGKATLDCGIEQYNSRLEWHHDDTLILNVVWKTGISRKGPAVMQSRSRIKGLTTLEVSEVRREDSGKYTCIADGNSQEHKLLVVSVSASSYELQVGSSVTLQCEVYGVNRSSEVKLIGPDGREHKESEISETGIWKCHFSYGGNNYSEQMEIKAKPPASSTSAPTLSSKFIPKASCPKCGTGYKSDFQLSWWIWVLVGVGSLVVVILMASVIVLCKRIRRRKKKLQNGRQSLRPKKYCQCGCPTAAVKPQQGRQKGKPSALPLPPLLME